MVPKAQGPDPEAGTQGVPLRGATPAGSTEEGWAGKTDVTPTPSSPAQKTERGGLCGAGTQLRTRVPETKPSQQNLTCRQPPKGSFSLLSLPCQKADWQRDPRVPAPVPGLPGRRRGTPSPGNLGSGSRESGCFKTRRFPIRPGPH